MSDPDLTLIERAAARGLVPQEALERARRECRGPAADWLLAQKLLTRDQLRDLLEDELPPLPRSAGSDPSWAILVIFFVIVGMTMVGFMLYSYGRKPPAVATPPRRPPPNPVLAAGAAMTAGDYPAAVAHLTDALAGSPRSADLFTSRAAAHHKMKNFGAALADAEEAVSIDPSGENGRVIRASILIDLGRAPEAVADLEKLPSSPNRDAVLKWAQMQAGGKK